MENPHAVPVQITIARPSARGSEPASKPPAAPMRSGAWPTVSKRSTRNLGAMPHPGKCRGQPFQSGLDANDVSGVAQLDSADGPAWRRNDGIQRVFAFEYPLYLVVLRHRVARMWHGEVVVTDIRRDQEPYLIPEGCLPTRVTTSAM